MLPSSRLSLMIDRYRMVGLPLAIVACLTFPSKITGCDRLQVGAATRATSIISRLTDIAVLDLHFLGIEIRTFVYLVSWINISIRPVR